MTAESAAKDHAITQLERQVKQITAELRDSEAQRQVTIGRLKVEAFVCIAYHMPLLSQDQHAKLAQNKEEAQKLLQQRQVLLVVRDC